MAGEHPGLIDTEAMAALEDLLKNTGLGKMRQSLFLFREAANTLCTVITRAHPSKLAERSLSCLERILRHTDGAAHRAAAEALGALPFLIQPPRLQHAPLQQPPRIGWQELVARTGYRPDDVPTFFGRSLVAPLKGSRRVLAIKMARAGDSPEALASEISWMDHLRSGGYAFDRRFDIPEAINIRGSAVFRLSNLPVKAPAGTRLHPKGYAIGYLALREYFSYPNEHGDGRPLTPAGFTEVLARNAYLLGKLAGRGIVHEAPIPLFHNRVQQDRRRDQGRYEWFRAGRLDRWLTSCAYPNLGITGLRDFEHMCVVDGAGVKLYRHIGTHLLSLLLVAGSYFRNRNCEKVGLDPQGQPVDARDLFDPGALKLIVMAVFRGYYQGFTGKTPGPELPLDLDRLTERMIDEMGVDRHMEEFFRVVDQNQLKERQFEQFLAERGFSMEQIAAIEKGKDDIVIYSGPHLGAFNDRISLPELIAAVETMSAVCVCGRHLQERAPVSAAA